MQIENNQLISRRIDEYTNISRFLRPFFTSGKLRTDIVPENFVDGVLLGHRWDLEFALTLALEGTSPLIALGDVHGEYGAAEIITSDEQWQSKMIAAANRALLIIVVPLNRPSTLWEVQQIFANTNLLQKTLFMMPPTKGIIHRNALSFFRRESLRRSWNSARTVLLRTGVKVPTYTSKGRFFHLSKEGEVDAILPLRRLIPGWIKLIATCFEAADDSVGTRLQHVRERWTIPITTRLRLTWNYLVGSTVFSSTGVKAVIASALFALVLRTVGFEPFNIPSGSMVPTLLVGDYLFVSKFSYGYSRYCLPFGLPLVSGRVFFRPPARGDVVVFKVPTDDSTDFIRRLIGLPGDRVQLRQGDLYINDELVLRRKFTDEQWSDNVFEMCALHVETLPGGVAHQILKRTSRGPMNNTAIFNVPKGTYFLMGDNRDNSSDSRVAFGGKAGTPDDEIRYVPAENLIGPARFIFFSTDGSAPLWQPWKWPFAIRYDRLFRGIN